MRNQRTTRIVGASAAIVLLLGIISAGWQMGSAGPAATHQAVAVDSSPLPAPPAPATTTTTTAPRAQVPVSTTLATPNGLVTTYAGPAGAPNGTVGVWYGYPLVLPVVSEVPGWLQVRLPARPNQSTAWIHSSDATLSTTPYRIVVEVGAERLRVYQAGQLIVDIGVGVGAPATPTVTGSYFITVKAPPPNSSYGPFILSTSAHSDAIQSWEGAGDAIIAIHGPITSYADSIIGTGHARVSNGCIRLHDADLVHLSMIEAGTPLDILA